jgi:hypothetical protein
MDPVPESKISQGSKDKCYQPTHGDREPSLGSTVINLEDWKQENHYLPCWGEVSMRAYQNWNENGICSSRDEPDDVLQRPFSSRIIICRHY